MCLRRSLDKQTWLKSIERTLPYCAQDVRATDAVYFAKGSGRGYFVTDTGLGGKQKLFESFALYLLTSQVIR